MLTRLVPVLFMSFVTVSGYAAPVCDTLPQCQQLKAQVDARIQELQVEQFPAVYTDNTNQLSWSKKLPGTYTNGCAKANGEFVARKCTLEILPDGSRQVKVDDSYAAIACKKIGARLPTKSEFDSLIRNFDHITDKSRAAKPPRLTDKGIAAMQAVFGDMDNWFWSSSLSSPNHAGNAFVFGGSIGHVDYYDYRSEYNAVRCVVDL